MKIHFIGIGGIGMSALAGISKKDGHFVSGSDKEKTNITEYLKKEGIRLNIGHNEKNLPDDSDFIVVTQAVKKDNPELKKAQKLNIPIKDRSEYLGELMKNKKAIAVAGTHGKTTISSMIAVILENAQKDPTVAVGGLIPEINNKNWRRGNSEFMVVEACEYRSSFLKLKPFCEIISNIEEEHLDWFKNLDDIINIFEKFLKLIPKDGFAVLNGDNINIQKVLNKLQPDFEIITYGLPEGSSEWTIQNVIEENESVNFEVYKNKQKIDDFTISIPGKHNALNALSAIVVASKLGISLKNIKDALKNFKGAVRRMERKGEKNGVLVVDDYGHHPTEIKATLEAMKSFYRERKTFWVVFQPHQYSRTRLLFQEFIKAFSNADKIIINDIYEVRDTKEDISSVNSEKLAQRIQKENPAKEVLYIPTFEKTSEFLKKNTKQGDIIITIGAGPVNKVGELFLK